MKKFLFSLSLCLVFAGVHLNSQASLEQAPLIWNAQPTSLNLSGTISSIQWNDNQLLVGTSQGLFSSLASEDGFYAEDLILNESVSDVYIDQGRIYVASYDDVYLSEDDGRSWKKIFTADEDSGVVCYHVLAHQQYIYLGTNQGVYYKEQTSREWERLDSSLLNKSIYDLEKDDDFIYVMTTNEVFRFYFDRRESVTRIYQQGTVSESDDDASGMKDLTVSDKSIFVFSSRLIQMSSDQGQTWTELTSQRLPLSDVNEALVIKEGSLQIFAATNKGMFVFAENNWDAIYQGMMGTKIAAVSGENENNVVFGVQSRLFKLKKEKPFSYDKTTEFVSNRSGFSDDPSIRQVQKWAIYYAEVYPEKIRGWRRMAQAGALLPTVSVDFDRDGGELYHWDTGQSPDVLQKGVDFTDWGVSVSWDFGKLVWNDDQLDIDVRSRLMVQLREEVIDQVTRLYFERKRLLMELSTGGNRSSEEIVQKSIRIEELTGLIDGYTNGQFSQYNEEQHSTTKGETL